VLVGLFGLQHSGMAREGFKRWWTRVVPEAIQRSAYVVATSLCLIFLFWQWRPIDTAILWSLPGWPAALLIATSLLGWGIVVLATFLVDHFDLFGVRQVWFAFRGAPLPPIEFRTPLLYQVTRHPLYLGFLIAFWSTPFMTLGHLVFASAMTAYILVGIQLEERDLVGVLGDTYRRYRRRVPMLIPVPRSRRGLQPVQPGPAWGVWRRDPAPRPDLRESRRRSGRRTRERPPSPPPPPTPRSPPRSTPGRRGRGRRSRARRARRASP